MTQYLLPRLTASQAIARLAEIETSIANGVRPTSLINLEPKEAVPNPTGGKAATSSLLHQWRQQVVARVALCEKEKNEFGVQLGRAIQDVINPVPSDAAHDGIWSFLSLYVFPDLVMRRWPGSADLIDGEICFSLPKARWIGAQAGRDRNYVKLSWRRWRILGGVMETASPPLGEDEFGALLERTAVARNHRLVVAAAQCVVSIGGTDSSRMQFTRDLMKRICYQTGARSLDILSDEELAQFVENVALEVRASA